MKCDNCLYLINIAPVFDQPYPEIYCAKGHWEGFPIDTESMGKESPDKELWGDCEDYRNDPEE